MGVNKLTIIGSDNGLSSSTCNNAVMLLIGPQGTNFNEVLIETLIFAS